MGLGRSLFVVFPTLCYVSLPAWTYGPAISLWPRRGMVRIPKMHYARKIMSKSATAQRAEKHQFFCFMSFLARLR